MCGLIIKNNKNSSILTFEIAELIKKLYTLKKFFFKRQRKNSWDFIDFANKNLHYT